MKTSRTIRSNDQCVRVPMRLLEDESLSWKAKGLMCYLLSTATGKASISELAEHGTDGESAIRSAMSELKNYKA